MSWWRTGCWYMEELDRSSGNTVGGVALRAALNYAQVISGEDKQR